MAEVFERARRQGQAPAGSAPAGPEDTGSVEGDVDRSDFTKEPDLAAADRQSNPPPPPPPKPPTPAGVVEAKNVPPPPPKPAAKRVGKALVAGPKGRGHHGGKGERPAPAPGEVVKKPAPPLPPAYVNPKKAGAQLPPPPAPPKPVKPKQDPAFAKVATAAKMTVKQAQKHPKGKDEAASAQGAAVPPANDIDAQAKANRADTMATAKPKPFDEDAFVAAVGEAMRKSAPKNLEETGDVGTKAGNVKGEIGKKVAQGKDAAGGEVEAKTAQAPDPSTATPKPVTPMAPLEIEKPGGMQASGAMPAPVPNEQVDFRNGPAKVDNQMAEANVTEEQLAESNEPEFTGALDAKKEGEEHSQQAPADVRQAEAGILKQAAVASAADEKKAVGDANSSIGSAVGKIAGQKDATKSKDEIERKKVADHINSIFDTTKNEVEDILSGIDTKVDEMFTAGEAEIRKSFTDDWNARLNAYKDDRYSGWRGPFRWARDKFRGLPAKANQLFAESKAIYERDMQKLIRGIAKTVSSELNRATVRIEQGRGEVATYVASLKGDLAKFGQEAADDMADKFETLDSSVKEKFDDLAGSLAKRYQESQAAVDEEITAAQEANKGLIDKAVDAVKGVIRVINQLKDMILNVLSRISSVMGEIIDHPIKFLKNFVSAVKAGITGFMERIDEHLQKGLMGWLFGSLDAKGIEIPDSFSIEGIMKLVLSVLGVTWTFIREKIAKKIGEPAMAALESGADIIKKVVTGGPGVLWEMLLEKFTEFQEMVVGEIKNFVIEKVVKSGITFLISLLNPAAAFIKACKMIYDVVMFFVEKGSEIKEFVDTVIDAAADVARGGTGGIAEKIEGVLARLLPLAISFLANILGLGGVGEKVHSIIDKVRKPIHKAMDKVVDVVVKMTAPIWKPAKKLFEKGKNLYGKAKDKVVKTYEAGKAKVKEIGGRVKDVAKAGYNKVKTKVKQTGQWVGDKAKGVGKKVGDTARAVKEFFTVRINFSEGNEKHELYTIGQSPKLMVASKKPQPLDNHEDPTVRTRYAEYLAALAKAKTPAAQKVATKVPLQKLVAALKKWFKGSGGNHPEASAPGIGNIAPHRNQLGRLANVPDWHMESEHVLPRAMSNAVFQALKQSAIPANKKDYNAQHTILIYKRASKMKTHGEGADNALTAELKSTIGEIMGEFNKTKGSDKGRALKLVYDVLSNLLMHHAEDAEVRTFDAIRAENTLNGHYRGKPGMPEPPTPSLAKVKEAGARQLADIVGQLQQRLSGDDLDPAELDLEPHTKPTTMAGAGHTLKYDPKGGSNGKAKLTLASVEGDLDSKVQARLDVLKVSAPTPTAEIEALTSILAQSQAVKDIQRWKKDPKPDEAVKNALEALGDAIARYGAQFRKKDIGGGETEEDQAALLAKFGMPVENAKHAQDVCRRFGVQILVRATNPLSPERAARPQDYLPKPAYIKAKTINSLDAQLGAHAGVKLSDVGVVGFFEPKMPAGSESLPPEKFAALQARFHLRHAEYLEDKAKMEMKVEKGFIKIVDGKVRHAKTGKEFGGDHDIFKILDESGAELYEAHGVEQENGAWLVEDNYRKLKKQIVDALRGGPFNAQHGALLDWKPKTDRDKAIYEVIKNSGEALLKITGATISRA
jgi:phage-related protein